MIERVYLDLDETTVDLCTKWAYYMNSRYGTDYTRDTVPYGRAEAEREEGNRWIDFLRIPGFMADLDLMEGDVTRNVLLQLASEGRRILPVTRAVAWESSKDKYSFAHTKFRIPGIIGTMGDLVVTGAKDVLDPSRSVLIDDDPRHLGSFKGHSICYTRPWNENEYFRYRADSWSEIPGLIKRIERENLLLSESELGYLAGLIDGEGHIGIYMQGEGDGSPTAVLEIGNTNRSVIEWLTGRISGGGVTKTKSTNSNWSDQFKWRISQHKAGPVLRSVVGRLVIKQGQARIALELIDSMYLRGKTPLDEATLSSRKKWMDDMKNLNKTGVAHGIS